MDLLSSIKELGLPAWLWISAAILIILRTIGLLDPLISFFRNLFVMLRERVEASAATERTEQIATWTQLTDLIRRLIDRDDRLTDYLISNGMTGISDIKGELKSQKYHLRSVEGKLTLMIQIFSEWYDKRRILDDDRIDNQNKASYQDQDHHRD